MHHHCLGQIEFPNLPQEVQPIKVYIYVYMDIWSKLSRRPIAAITTWRTACKKAQAGLHRSLNQSEQWVLYNLYRRNLADHSPPLTCLDPPGGFRVSSEEHKDHWRVNLMRHTKNIVLFFLCVIRIRHLLGWMIYVRTSALLLYSIAVYNHTRGNCLRSKWIMWNPHLPFNLLPWHK